MFSHADIKDYTVWNRFPFQMIKVSKVVHVKQVVMVEEKLIINIYLFVALFAVIRICTFQQFTLYILF